MSALMEGRRFQLWEYHVSHGSILIRSPAAPEVKTSVDIICMGLEYIAAPRHLGEITICQPAPTELEQLENMLKKKLSPSHVWALQGSTGRFLIVAASLHIREHHGDIFESPFSIPRPVTSTGTSG